MASLTDIRGREILDSRGNPTVEVAVSLDNGIVAIAGVPSGASTGSLEAVELRDGDESRYGGKGVLKAVSHVNGVLREKLLGMDVFEQNDIDKAMCELDGTENKSRLGANAILGISLAVARAASMSREVPLFLYIRSLFEEEAQLDTASVFPIPMFNVLNGGQHSDSGLSVQEFKLFPKGISQYDDQLRAGSEIFHALRGILAKAGYSVGVGDEGGFAPRLESHVQAFEMLLAAIEKAGYVAGKDIFLGIDAAANSFYVPSDAVYALEPEGVRLSREQLLNVYAEWIEKYHLVSIEDALFEGDWEGWTIHCERFGKGKDILLIGDDLLVTNSKRVREAIDRNACNAVLIKPNQIGTLSETIETMCLAKAHGLKTVVSHRSGETNDDFIADLAVGASADCIKTGSLSRGERLSKYNRLLAIQNPGRP
ncbi:MAG: phosphopyruvate hydratase [Candidatus Moraniibacteriota bacterium]|nr:MAG: phosphopyruvate hydratase [Candidatus Moranbacteria bacterium]